MKKKIELPHIGARTIKTGITVFLCSFVSLFILKRDTPFIASVSGITCIQNNIESSVTNGKNRILGTIFGAIMGFLILYISQFIKLNNFTLCIISSLGTIITIYLCILFSIQNCIINACIMLLILLMTIGEEQWLTYSILRTMDTFIGAMIGISVNATLFKKSFKNVEKKK